MNEVGSSDGVRIVDIVGDGGLVFGKGDGLRNWRLISQDARVIVFEPPWYKWRLWLWWFVQWTCAPFEHAVGVGRITSARGGHVRIIEALTMTPTGLDRSPYQEASLGNVIGVAFFKNTESPDGGDAEDDAG